MPVLAGRLVIHSFRIDHDAVGTNFYYQFTEVTVHTEPITLPTENDRRQNTNTKPEREKNRWEKNLQLLTMVRTI